MPLPRRLLRAAGDDRLVDQLRRGNGAAFEAMYERYHRPLLGYCRHLVGSASEAEDVIQQVFAAAHRTLCEDGGRIELRPWLYTVARNTCISHLRRRREVAGKVPASAPSPVAEAEQRADVRALVSDIATLPEDQRSALVLSELGDLAHDQIASVVGCERAKVKSLVHQARQRLFDRRRARDTSCDEVRDRLSALRGGSLRRAWLQIHLRGCPGCREYREEVLRQRALMVLAIPVPSAGLRDSVLAATGGGGGAAAGGGAGAGSVAAGGGAAGAGGTSAATVTGGVASVGTSASSGLLPALASSMAAKALVGAAVAAGAAGGGLAIHRAGPPEDSPGDSTATTGDRFAREGSAAAGPDAARSAPDGGQREESVTAPDPPPDEESTAYAEPTDTEASARAEPEEEEQTDPEAADEGEGAPEEEPSGSRERSARSRGERPEGRPAGESTETSDPAQAEGVEVELEAPTASKRRSATRQLEDAVP